MSNIPSSRPVPPTTATKKGKKATTKQAKKAKKAPAKKKA